VAIDDLLETISENRKDASTLKELLRILRSQRRGKNLSTAEILFIDLPH
jgi:hypothetical protein